MITTLFAALAVFAATGLGVAVYDAQTWCERHDYMKHKGD